MSNLKDHITQVEEHLLRCEAIHGENYASIHEGYAVIKEELDELWHEIKCKNPSYDKIYLESRDLAQTVIKMMITVRKLKQADERK